MEHPELENAIRFCQSIGSITGEFLQFDGMKFRSDAELEALLTKLKSLGVKLIDLTFYGTEQYHDRFAARHGDFRLMVHTLRIAVQLGLEVSVSIPLTGENCSQIDALLNILEQNGASRFTCFVPHSEGRGRLLDKVRLTLIEYEALSKRVKARLSRERFKTEREWIVTQALPCPDKRALTLTLRPDNVDFFENLSFTDTVSYLEKLDNTYYQAVPSFRELMGLYGDKTGTKMYSARDLYLHYQRKYIAEHNLQIYDINDERQCFSRRF